MHKKKVQLRILLWRIKIDKRKIYVKNYINEKVIDVFKEKTEEKEV